MSLKKKIRRHLRNRPTYEIDPSYANNVALAESQVYGRNPAIMRAEENIRDNTADMTYNALQTSDSAGGILGMLNSLNRSQSESFENLAQQEANIQQQNIGQLYQQRQALAEEKDKAFDYNVNQPYQTRLAELRDRRKARQETWGKVFDTVGGLAVGALTGGIGTGIGVTMGGLFKKKSTGTTPD